MKISKRIILFVIVNILVVLTITTITSLLGLRPYLTQKGLNYQSLALFCLLWGFGGAFISLALSRVMAKWMMGVRLIDPESTNQEERILLQKVYEYSSRAGLTTMPEVGIYDSPELNAFATGPTKSRALVAVSSGLLNRMSPQEINGVLAHEVAHIANGDMVTMTLLQGVINAFVMFVARIAGFFISQAVEEERRPWVQLAVVFVLEIILSILGMMVVAAFSRYREYRADKGGAELSGQSSMIAALERLQIEMNKMDPEMHKMIAEQEPSAIASFKISSSAKSWIKLFSTHPELQDRISRLKNVELI